MTLTTINEFLQVSQAAPRKVATQARTHRPRLFTTYYYASTKDGAGKWARIGRACTRDNAVRAAIVKVLNREFLHVDIYDEDYARCAFISRVRNKILVVCV